jgi:hypothetical protein
MSEIAVSFRGGQDACRWLGTKQQNDRLGHKDASRDLVWVEHAHLMRPVRHHISLTQASPPLSCWRSPLTEQAAAFRQIAGCSVRSKRGVQPSGPLTLVDRKPTIIARTLAARYLEVRYIEAEGWRRCHRSQSRFVLDLASSRICTVGRTMADLVSDCLSLLARATGSSPGRSGCDPLGQALRCHLAISPLYRACA